MKIRQELQIVHFKYSVVTKNYDPYQTNLFTESKVDDSFTMRDAMLCVQYDQCAGYRRAANLRRTQARGLAMSSSKSSLL